MSDDRSSVDVPQFWEKCVTPDGEPSEAPKRLNETGSFSMEAVWEADPGEPAPPPRPDLKDPKVQESMSLIETTGVPPGTVYVLNGHLLFAAGDVIASLEAGDWSVIDAMTVVYASGYLSGFRPADVADGEVASATIRVVVAAEEGIADG